MIQILKSNGQPVATDVLCARSLPAQLRGLMFKRGLPETSAMLFVLKKPACVNIHMLFMRFAIDVMVLDEHRVIQRIETLKPWSGYMRASKTKYVIEMNAGRAARCALRPGETLQFKYV